MLLKLVMSDTDTILAAHDVVDKMRVPEIMVSKITVTNYVNYNKTSEIVMVEVRPSSLRLLDMITAMGNLILKKI